jgi:TonB family protein
VIPALLLALTLTSPLAAQHVLMAQDGGKMLLVCAAQGTTPCVEVEGKVVPITASRFSLREVHEYLPVFVSVANEDVRTSSATLNGTGSLNNDFHFNADFETDYRLNDVFVVLALDTMEAGNTLFIWEVGSLEPRRVKHVSITAPMTSQLGAGRYRLHLFSGGAEVLQSEIPFFAREAALDRMVARRVKDLREAAPRFFIGSAPEYPAGLRKANLKGQAVVSVRIGANGAVFDPAVKSATNPSFGDAAAAAVRRWRFLPMVKNGHPVETKADVPVVFDRPNPTGEQS